MLVAFTPHRPHLLHKDLAFFDAAEARGFVVSQLESQTAARPVFEGDDYLGNEELRSKVFLHCLTLPPATPPVGFGPRVD